MELSNKFDNKYAEITGTPKKTTSTAEQDTLFVSLKDKPVKKIMITPRHVSMIVPKERKDDVDTEDSKYITESDDDFEFKPQGVGRPKKTYEGIASRKRQNSDKEKQNAELNMSIAERRARRKIKPSTRNIDMDMSDMKDSTEEDTEDEGLIIEPDRPLEKRGRGRPRKHPQELKPGTSSSPVIISARSTIISPGKAVQITPAKSGLTPGKVVQVTQGKSVISPGKVVQVIPRKTQVISPHTSPTRPATSPKAIVKVIPKSSVSQSVTVKPSTIITVSSPTKSATVTSPQPKDEEAATPKPTVSSEKRGRGRPRKDTQSPAAGSDREQQPDVTSSSDQFSVSKGLGPLSLYL